MAKRRGAKSARVQRRIGAALGAEVPRAEPLSALWYGEAKAICARRKKTSEHASAGSAYEHASNEHKRTIHDTTTVPACTNCYLRDKLSGK